MVFTQDELALMENFKNIDEHGLNNLKDRFCEEMNEVGVKVNREDLRMGVDNIFSGVVEKHDKNYIIVSFNGTEMQYRVTVNYDGTITMIYKVVPEEFSDEEIRGYDETCKFDLEVESITYENDSEDVSTSVLPLREPINTRVKEIYFEGKLDRYLRCPQWDIDDFEAFILLRYIWGVHIAVAYRKENRWVGRELGSYDYPYPIAFRVLDNSVQAYLKRDEPNLEMIYKNVDYEQPISFWTAYRESGWKNIVEKTDFDKLLKEVPMAHVLSTVEEDQMVP